MLYRNKYDKVILTIILSLCSSCQLSTALAKGENPEAAIWAAQPPALEVIPEVINGATAKLIEEMPQPALDPEAHNYQKHLTSLLTVGYTDLDTTTNCLATECQIQIRTMEQFAQRETIIKGMEARREIQEKLIKALEEDLPTDMSNEREEVVGEGEALTTIREKNKKDQKDLDENLSEYQRKDR